MTLRDILYTLACMGIAAAVLIGGALLCNTLSYGPLDKRRIIKPRWLR